MANRMKRLLDPIIAEAQSAFILGRSIVDNIVIAFEVQHFLKRKTQGKEGYMALKLNMSKAYDRVEWRFLEAVMQRLGFHSGWINLVLQCVATVLFNVQVNNEIVGPIIPTRGIRQGDPLSPYLFILIAEGLSARIREGGADRHLQGIRLARSVPTLTHLLFADDRFLFFRANEVDCTFIKMLDTYSGGSGQLVNYDKSSVRFNANVAWDDRDYLCSLLGVNEDRGGGKYLGLPSLVGRNKKEIFGYIKEKVVQRIQRWNSRFLSRARREILLKTVLQAMPQYAMNVFLLPADLCEEIERVMNAFWWRGHTFKGKGIRWRNWSDLCVPKSSGGMGFRKLRRGHTSLEAY
ncbi:unnamed protein product [Cuscuta europaea]|uniref:Reverse transcriptase domain-containing protein n=1 Tax=Cuscuta europaea TaxID=41803 RepID=A0A9P0ZD02_CUSEU|nr:unnamed protein product [Cuscuta europaea]